MRTGVLGPSDYMHWLSYSDSTTQSAFFDEIRFSNANINETVLVIPEPGAASMLVITGAWLVARRRKD